MQPMTGCFFLCAALLTMGCQNPDDSTKRSSVAALSTNPTPRVFADAGVRTLHFSGYEWRVKAASVARAEPGPNYFGDGPTNVWVDTAGKLHLRIAYKDGQWWAAEVISLRSFGYGTYRFSLGTNVDDLDPNVVLGFFTWSDDPAFSHREIDIELSHWGHAQRDNGQCVVQPYSRPGHLMRFALPQGLNASVHSFVWRPGHVVCRSQSQSGIYEHTFTAGIPVPGGENARINLWLLGRLAPQHGQDVEVVIDRFAFRSL